MQCSLGGEINAESTGDTCPADNRTANNSHLAQKGKAHFKSELVS
jgi:hypothetical protein